MFAFYSAPYIILRSPHPYGEETLAWFAFFTSRGHYPDVLKVCFGSRSLVDSKRRSRATAPEFPDRNAELLGLVGEVVLNAGAGEDHDADRQNVEHRIVAFEWRRFGVLGPVGLEGDLRHLAVVAPFGDPPCSSTMSGCLAWTRSSLSQIRR